MAREGAGNCLRYCLLGGRPGTPLEAFTSAGVDEAGPVALDALLPAPVRLAALEAVVYYPVSPDPTPRAAQVAEWEARGPPRDMEAACRECGERVEFRLDRWFGSPDRGVRQALQRLVVYTSRCPCRTSLTSWRECGNHPEARVRRERLDSRLVQ